MTVEAPDYAVTHPDRDLDCQEAVEPELQRVLADANTNGWGTLARKHVDEVAHIDKTNNLKLWRYF